jgi:hypothetical protein
VKIFFACYRRRRVLTRLAAEIAEADALLLLLRAQKSFEIRRFSNRRKMTV